MVNGLTTIPRIDIKSGMEGRKGEPLWDFLITIEVREEGLISLKRNRTIERGGGFMAAPSNFNIHRQSFFAT